MTRKYGIYSKRTGRWLAAKPVMHKRKIRNVQWADQRAHPFLAMHEAERFMPALRTEDPVIVSEDGQPPSPKKEAAK